MYFDPLPILEAEGCYLAHSLMTSEGRIPKGSYLDSTLIKQLVNSGIDMVVVAQLEPSELHEDRAASLIATALITENTRLTKARTGRVNIHATKTGLCLFDRESIISANAISEGITVATLPENQWVSTGRMLATVKIIPYGIAAESAVQVAELLSAARISVQSPAGHTAELIQTRLPALKESVLDKTRKVTEVRLQQRCVSLEHEARCTHEPDPLAALIRSALTRSADWILIAGASATSDRNDVVPKAITAAGGQILRYGMPVDPGNLLLLAHIGTSRVIGLPGCARSSRHNGLDLVLDRLACNMSADDAWLNSLSVGGLLTENADRPSPRVAMTERTRVGGLVLAAGSSTRAGSVNKLLYKYQGSTFITHVVRQLALSRANQVVVVTGFEHELIEYELKNERVVCCHNPAFASGMASSLARGVSRLMDCDAIVVCLGDMPHVSEAVINQLIDAFFNQPDKSIFIPVNAGKRGNPVLISKVFFDTILALDGDSGAKLIWSQYPGKVCEVPVDTTAIFRDYDTLEELNRLS